MKRLLALVLTAGVLLALGCGGSAEDRYKNSSKDKPKAAYQTGRLLGVARPLP